MGIRFYRRVKILPGITVNLGKRGASLSLGPRGSKLTFGSRGVRTSVGIPGTGLYYTSKLSPGRNRSSKQTHAPRARSATIRPEDKLRLGFFKRLVMSKTHEDFVDGCREYVLGNEKSALRLLLRCEKLTDAKFLAGFLALKLGQPGVAARMLDGAARNHGKLGILFEKYGIQPILTLPITAEYSACVGADYMGAKLGLVEALQATRKWDEAIAEIDRLLDWRGDDPVLMLSLVELLYSLESSKPDRWRRIVELTAAVENDSETHATLLLYKARALRQLHLPEAAKQCLTQTMRRKKNRPGDLLRWLRYERALAYEDLGRARQARKDMEIIYAADPGFEDVARRLKVT